MRIAGMMTLNSTRMILLWAMVTWFSKDVDTLHLTTGWKRLSKGEEGPGRRSGASVWTDKLGQGWFFGGRGSAASNVTMNNNNSSSCTRLRSDLWSYDIKAGRWSLIMSDEATATAAVTANGTSAASSNSASESKGAAAAAAALLSPTGRELSTMCGITGGNLVIFGGRTSGDQADNDLPVTSKNFRVTNQMLIWHPKLLPVEFETRVCGRDDDPSCPSARYDSLFWCDDDFMNIVGGTDAKGRRLIDFWKLDLQRLTWTRLPTPATGCSWTTPDNVTVVQPVVVVFAKNDTNKTDVAYVEQEDQVDDVQMDREPLALVWSSPISGIHVLCDKIAAVDDQPNLQLWHRRDVTTSSSGERDVFWSMVGESGSRHDLTTWPGVHLHGDACSDATFGNLWLFGGQSRISGRAFLNNDVWMYNVSAAVWIKPEMPDASDEPAQRHRAAGWCHQDSMFIYGGSTSAGSDACDNNDCVLLDDLWMLDTSGSRAAAAAATKALNAIRQSDLEIGSMNTLRRNNFKMPMSMSDGSMTSTTSDNGVEPYGSAAIFFAISLSMFAIFGVVLFFRRCVTCPPRDSILLKEPPPVRYTVIPDDTSYSM